MSSGDHNEVQSLRDGMDRMCERFDARIGGLTTAVHETSNRVLNLEIANRALLQRTMRHEKILKVATYLGFIAAGVLVGAGVLGIDKLLSLVIH